VNPRVQLTEFFFRLAGSEARSNVRISQNDPATSRRGWQDVVKLTLLLPTVTAITVQRFMQYPRQENPDG